MTKRSRLLLFGGLLMTVALAAALLAALLFVPNALMTDNCTLESVHLTGTVAAGDGEPRNATMEQMEALGEERSIRFTGYFSRELPAGSILMMRIRDARVSMRVNGAEVFSFGAPGTYPSIAKSPGDVWTSFASPGITTGDLVEITVERIYTNTSANAFTAFFSRMATGSQQALLQRMLRENFLNVLFGAVACSFGILVLAIAIVSLFRKMPYVRSMFLFSGTILGAGLWMLFDFEYISLLLPYPVFNTTAAVLGLYFLPSFLLLYLRTFLTGWRRTVDTVAGAGCFVLLDVGIFLQGCGAYDLFEFQMTAWHLLLSGVLLAAVLLWLELRPNGRKEKPRVYLALLSILPVLIGTVLDTLNFCFGDFRTTIGLHVSILFFAVMQVGILMNALQENARRAVQLEHDLLQSRVMLMLSQIKPHFLYNSLTAIKQLCTTDPQRAEEAVGLFATYLRSNLDSIGSDKLIPLSRELSHTQCYLQLEQMRFGDRVRVVYDLRYKAFSLPSLTMQPLVENAVRYGITKKPGGGTVTIYTDENDAAFLVRVSDDGVGFDPAAQPKADERTHIGLENVRSRIAAMCEGTLEIESAPGKGTTATICIPKRDASEEE